MMFRQLKVGERLQPFTGTTGQGQAAMLVIAVVDSEQLHLWTEDRVYGFMQSDGCAVVVDMPRNPASD